MCYSGVSLQFDVGLTYKAGPGRKAGAKGGAAAPAPAAAASPRWARGRSSLQDRALIDNGPLPLQPHKLKRPLFTPLLVADREGDGH